MLEDITFQKFWTANYPNLGTNQPLIMVHAFMEVAYKAWLAGYVQCENDNDIDCHLKGRTDYRYAR